MSPPRERQRKAVVVGAGPVGCLAALALAKHCWSVEVYEGRQGVSDAKIQTLSVFLLNLSQTCAFPPLRLLLNSVPSTWLSHTGELLPWKQLVLQRHRDSYMMPYPCEGA